jgi:hypothetical protein
MRKVRTALFPFAIAIAATAQSAGWPQFSVPETGASVESPVAIFAEDAGPPETGFGRRFTTADGRATLAIHSMTNEANDSLFAFLTKKHPPSTLRTQDHTAIFCCPASVTIVFGTIAVT